VNESRAAVLLRAHRLEVRVVVVPPGLHDLGPEPLDRLDLELVGGFWNVDGGRNLEDGRRIPTPAVAAGRCCDDAPSLRFSGCSRMILVSAPRTLNARIGWIDSTLMWTWQPALWVKAREYWSGVGGR
jgi:hypothetical protein